MAQELVVAAVAAVGDTHCLLDVYFKDRATDAAVNITGFTPWLRGRGKRQTSAFSSIQGTVESGSGGQARFDWKALTATADFYICQAYLVDGSSQIQTAEVDFALVVKATP